MSKDIEIVIKNFPTMQNLGPDGFAEKFYQTFKELMLILLKLFQKVEEEEILLISLYKTRITLIPKVDSDTTRK